MRDPLVRVGAALSLSLAACTLDSTNPTGTGGASASSGATTSTTESSSASGTGGMASATTSSDAASSSGASPDASSSVASSSSGGPAMVPFCFSTKDDFDGYADADATFIALGQTAGPWEEDANNASDVTLVAGGRIRTSYGGGIGAFLELKSTVQLGGTCAITVRLVSTTGGDTALGIWDKTSDYTEITCFENNGTCQPLRAFGVNGGDVPLVNGGLYLGIVVKGTRLFAFHSGDGASWTLLPNLPANGVEGQPVLDLPVIPYFGQNPNSDESVWDDFDIHGIPASLVP